MLETASRPSQQIIQACKEYRCFLQLRTTGQDSRKLLLWQQISGQSTFFEFGEVYWCPCGQNPLVTEHSTSTHLDSLGSSGKDSLPNYPWERGLWRGHSPCSTTKNAFSFLPSQREKELVALFQGVWMGTHSVQVTNAFAEAVCTREVENAEKHLAIFCASGERDSSSDYLGTIYEAASITEHGILHSVCDWSKNHLQKAVIFRSLRCRSTGHNIFHLQFSEKVSAVYCFVIVGRRNVNTKRKKKQTRKRVNLGNFRGFAANINSRFRTMCVILLNTWEQSQKSCWQRDLHKHWSIELSLCTPKATC